MRKSTMASALHAASDGPRAELEVAVDALQPSAFKCAAEHQSPKGATPGRGAEAMQPNKMMRAAARLALC